MVKTPKDGKGKLVDNRKNSILAEKSIRQQEKVVYVERFFPIEL